MIYIDQETGKRVNPNAPYKGFSRLETPEQFLKAGVISIEDDPIPEGSIKNPDLYTIQEDWETSQRPYTVYTRKSDEQIAQFMQERANQESLAYLASTDWYVTRFAETGVSIPDAVKDARAAARTTIVKMEPV